MRAKTLKILADFRRDLINRKCSEKPVKSRFFRDFKGVKNALRGLLLSVRPFICILAISIGLSVNKIISKKLSKK